MSDTVVEMQARAKAILSDWCASDFPYVCTGRKSFTETHVVCECGVTVVLAELDKEKPE